MMLEGYYLPEDVYYHKEHMWMRVEGGLAVVGITDFAAKLAGPIKRVVTLEEEDEVEQDSPMGTISTGKWSGRLYAPVSGEIAEVNLEVEDNPRIINASPYGDGWILKIKPYDLQAELANLMYIGDGRFEQWFMEEVRKHARK